MNLAAFTQLLATTPRRAATAWEPWFITLAPGELGALEALCRAHHVALLDPIDRQLADLAAVRLPAGTPVGRQQFIASEVARAGGQEAYGNWVYLPWDGRIVHLLDAEGYYAVITNRNHHKITPDEQRRLRTKRVGVIGLSVGGEAAVTVAQEHLCGEIVLADFDTLDLSNVNRLNAGFDDLGVNKAVLIARRIVRIDPYLKIRIFEEGVTESNMGEFLGGLDLLLEECDGLGIKHEIRRRARAQRLNIVFAGDERGFISIEPYGNQPGLETFHGRVTAPQAPREAYPTPLAFMRALTVWLGGWDAISERSRQSLEQIGQTLCGYPQLASEARYAAGQVGHVARRLLLGEQLPPYVGHLDLDELLPQPTDRGNA